MTRNDIICMADRELLELAAKAAGIDLGSWCEELDAFWKGGRGESIWNPLTDDGDALRLAVKLRLYLEQYAERAGAWKIGLEAKESLGDDPYAATRRAIVRAAAEIGRNME
jgi:hypothetical protein